MATRVDADDVIKMLSEVETNPESEKKAYMTIWIVRTVLVAENMIMSLKIMMKILMMRVRKI